MNARTAYTEILAIATGAPLAAIPPLVVFCDLVNTLWIESERLADIAQHAARAIADDSRGQSRAIAPVFAVDILNDLFAPLMLEVDIDIGRLVALAADEALKQNIAAARIDLGDAQAVANHRVGG